MKVGHGICHGTFGELAQGVINNHPYLVPLPIKKYSIASFYPSHGSHLEGPSNKTKALLACENLLAFFGIKGGGKLVIESDIPCGKGMASSSADIVASIRAVADSYQLQLTPAIIIKLAISIEPTDAIMFSSIYSFDYIHGRVLERFGHLPSLKMLGMDFGGEIDTVAFNRKPKKYNDLEEALHNQAYHYVKRGIKEGNLSVLFKGTTLSSEINQRLLPKPYFNQLKEIASVYKCGIVIAHSGTVLGFLIDSDVPIEEEEKMRCTVEKMTNVNVFSIEALHQQHILRHATNP